MSSLRRSRTARISVVATFGVLLSITAVMAHPAHAGSYSDPAGDATDIVMPSSSGTFSAGDITAASDRIDGDGTVHLVVTSTIDHCYKSAGVGSPYDYGVVAPRIGIYPAGAVAPSGLTERNELLTAYGTTNYFFSTGTSTTGATDVPENISSVGTAITYDVSIPPALAGALGSFTWMAGDGCLGEYPNGAVDIIPNSGLFAVANGAAADTTAPSAPHSLHATAAARSSVTVGWSAASDNVAVTGYKVYKDGASPRTVAASARSAKVSLPCGSTHTISVRAFDAKGNMSVPAKVVVHTTTCLLGTPAGDTIVGTARADVIKGFGGNDTMSGRGGADKIYGGAGKDKLNGGAGKDKLYGGAGKDKLNGGPGIDTCYYSVGDVMTSCEHKVKQ